VRIEPRQQIIEVWKSIATYSNRDRQWTWGGQDERNSISDAEQLLCLLYPATEASFFRLDKPDTTAMDVLSALKKIGDGVQLPMVLIDAIDDYMRTYTAPDGTPVFSGGSYFRPFHDGDELVGDQRGLDVVDSFATSLSLTLSTLSFLKAFGRTLRKQAAKDKVAELEAITSRRLSAAMVGLLRSFTVNVFPADSIEGESLCRMLNQQNRSSDMVLDRLHKRLETLRANLRDTVLGLGEVDGLDNPNNLFECGWSWGVATGAPPVETTEHVGDQPEGLALSAPYMYFTVTALDAIANLNDDHVRIDGLLNAEQRRLAEALELRWTITRRYWSSLARFGTGRWPLEDIPWRAVDGVESVYFSLLVTAVVLHDLLNRRATDDDLTRTVAVLEELAVHRNLRLGRPIEPDDKAVGLHTPGVRLDLIGTEKLGPLMCWTVGDFAAVLLKRSLRAAGLSRNSGARSRLYALAEEALGHMWRRRLKTGPATGLWDDPSDLVPGVVPREAPSWYMTKRVIDCLTEGIKTILQPPLRGSGLIDNAAERLSEADHLFSQDRLMSSAGLGSEEYAVLGGIQTQLEQSRMLLQERPGTAGALADDVLRKLHLLRMAREDAKRSH
jgi:hypothetical protein